LSTAAMSLNPCASLSEYFGKRSDGHNCEIPSSYSTHGNNLLVHEASGILVWSEPLQFSSARDNSDEILYVYTHTDAFFTVNGSKQIFSHFHEFSGFPKDVLTKWGADPDSVIATTSAPDELGSKELALANLFTSESGESLSGKIQRYHESADACIPVLVPSSMARSLSLPPSVAVAAVAPNQQMPGAPTLLLNRPADKKGTNTMKALIKAERDLWIIQVPSSRQAAWRNAAGASAEEVIMKHMKHEDVRVRRGTLEALSSGLRGGCKALLGLVDGVAMCLEDDSDSVRSLAVEVIAKITQPGNRAAMESVTRHLKHETAKVRATVVQAIAKLAGPGSAEASELIATCLADTDDKVKLEAVCALRTVATPGNAAVAMATAKCIRDASEQVLSALVLIAVDLCAAGDANIVSQVKLRLTSAEAKVRRLAVSALSFLARKGDAAVMAAVAEVLNDADSMVRLAAVRTLGKLAADKGKAKMGGITEIVARCLKSTNVDTRMAAVKAIVGVAVPGDEVAVKALVIGLQDKEDALRWSAAVALEALSGDGRYTLQLLSQCLQESSSSDVREAVLRVVGKVAQPGDATAREVIKTAMQDDAWNVRCAAVWTTYRMADNKDAEALEALAGGLADRDPEVQMAALTAMIKVGSQDEKVAVAVKRCLVDPESRVRSGVIQVVMAAPRLGKPALLQDITLTLSDQDATVRRVALECLSKLEAKGDKKALRSMKPLLEDPQEEVRLVAVRALTELTQPEDSEIVDAIASKLDDPHWSVRFASLEGLGRLVEPSAAPTLAAIRLRLADADPTVKVAAKDAITSIGKREKLAAISLEIPSDI